MPFGRVISFQRVFSLFSYHLLDGIKILSTCRGILIDTIIEKYGDDIIEFCGIECDKCFLLLFLILRDIARYAKVHNTLVLTRDADFCIFDIPGVVFLDDVITNEVDFSVMTRDLIFTELCICNEFQLFFLIYLQGNDFSDGKNSDNKLIQNLYYVKKHIPKKLKFTDKKYGDVDLTPIEEQYSLDNGVPYPFNMITAEVSEMESFPGLGITEGRYGCRKQCVELLKKACAILNDPCLVNIHKIVFSPIQVAPLIHPVEYKEKSICMLLI